ncbi:MAG: B3/4 domain-containing protein [Enterococcus sp.]
MSKVIIDKNFWELFPEGQINVLQVKNLKNEYTNEEQKAQLKTLLNQSAVKAVNFVPDEPISENDVVKQWRQAFSKFKSKKGARSSIEALLKRAQQGREFSSISPLVDIYNSISLTYAVPCGGEDMHKIEGDVHLGMAQGGEAFFPLGAEKDAPALEGEIIYYDEAGAICRSLNWREAQRTMLTEETTDAVFFIEAVNEEQIDRSNEAIKALKDLLDSNFGTQATITQLTSDHSELDLG